MAVTPLTLRQLTARAVLVPMQRPLRTGGGAVIEAPLVLLDVHSEQGVSGSSYAFCYTPLALGPLVALLDNLGEALAGTSLAPADLEERLAATFRLIGPQGLTGIAASALDVAAWDAQAKAVGLPLVRLLGGSPRPLQAYDSRGLGLRPVDQIAGLADEARTLAQGGCAGVKLRLGYPRTEQDLAALGAVREAIAADTLVMSDYNQCLSVVEAEQRARALAGAGLYWIEEPTRADDYAGHARVRAAADTRIQIGENAWGSHDMVKALDAGACDCFMPDVGKIGGVSGWMRAAALADGRGVPVSSHLFPEVSAHLLAVTPTRHWLEWVDWAAPVLREPLELRGGTVTAPDRPGHGMAWDEDAVARYAA